MLELVEELLEEVKSGNVESVVYSKTDRDGRIETGWSTEISGNEILGMMEIGKQRVIETMREE
ncbi:hypothetical protein SAMN05192534_12355 [Alteribacillus persepolensis]|uniref:Uncharacterized protein n=2 Tax=Alteribacillus persepolensis TaxID=568899 RepID=A0A1G8I9R4_9BACI|nr:hypothetical protein SAMN05192534_12355 [Alteribacillus persepolensis]